MRHELNPAAPFVAPNLSPAQCDRQHAVLRDETIERHGILATPGIDLAAACARVLGREDWRIFNKAMAWVAAFTTNYCSQRRVDHDGKPLPEGIFMPDRAVPGEVYVVYANGSGRGYAFGGLLHLDEIATPLLPDAEPIRRARKLELVNAIGAKSRSGADDMAALRPLVSEFAALLLREDDVEILHEITNALPAVILLARVAANRRSVHAKKITTTLPGRWLGTSVVAGRS